MDAITICEHFILYELEEIIINRVSFEGRMRELHFHHETANSKEEAYFYGGGVLLRRRIIFNSTDEANFIQ